ncbi:myosin-binding protein 7-like [Cicer arietinum]|uniref:Myosin-binding protein 7-like n=1 Tax=Cicer arietinum TaxID=3827 RepID=A0A1S2XTG5_CICAR|nr:myosin-binding protein 7-like [Cicer arietinum]
MDLESSDDPFDAKPCKCRDCDCECGCSERSKNWTRSVKRKHDEAEKARQLNESDGIVRVEIGDECLALRQAVCSQQKAIQDLYSELEEERNAASSAANETMSMILRLQSEKAELEMEARQFKRFVEERTSHDQQELLELEDLLYKREQAIHSLTCEVQAYKHRLMSYGLTELEAEGDNEFPPYEYPPLKCNVMHVVTDDDNDDDVEKYVFGETPRDRLRNLENRISQMERTPTYSQMNEDFCAKNIIEKVIVGQSPRRNKHSRKFSCDSSSFGPDLMLDSSPRINGSFRKMDSNGLDDFSNLKKMDDVFEVGDNMTDKVYTIDSEFKGSYDEYVTTPREFGNQGEFEDPNVKKLYTRLQALEADRESMRQAIISMRTDKAQLVLLKEIAQHLCKEMSVQRKVTVRSFIGGFSFFTIFKWVASIVFWRKRGHQIKYMFGLPSNNNGLLMLLDKGPGVRSWRYISRTQM